MGKDTGADPRGGFKVVGAGESPQDPGGAQPAARAADPGRQPRALRPRIIVLGLGGAGGNAVHNMLEGRLEGVELFVANTDSQALETSICKHRLQLGRELTGGLGAGGRPEVGRAAAEESLDEILEIASGASLAFIAAGMGGGTGTGAAPVVAEAIRKKGVLTVAVVTKPFRFEGELRMEVAEEGIAALERHVDTLIVIPNQNLFKIATEKTSVADAFHRADNVLFAGVRGVTDLMVKPGLINLDFADFRSVMTQTGKAIMGAGEADGPQRAIDAAEAAMANPLLEDSTVDGARGVLINVTGGRDLTLFELDEAVESVRAVAHPKANIIVGSAFDEGLEGKIRVSVLATGIRPKQAPAAAAGVDGGAAAAEPAAKAADPRPQEVAPPGETAAAAPAEPKPESEPSASDQAAIRPAAPASAPRPGQPAEAAVPPSSAPPAIAAPKAETVAVEPAVTAPKMPAAATPAAQASAPAVPVVGPQAKGGDRQVPEEAPPAPRVLLQAAAKTAPEAPARPPVPPPCTPPAAPPAGSGGRLTLEDILRRAERAMEDKKAARAAESAEAPAPRPVEPASEPGPAAAAPEAGPAADEDANLDALIDEVLIRSRKAAESEPPEPTLEVPPLRKPGPGPGGTSTDALLEDLAFSLASDDPFVLDEPAPGRAAEAKDVAKEGGAKEGGAKEDGAKEDGDAFFRPEAAAAPRPRNEDGPPPLGAGDTEDAFQAELDRRARERARAALQALSSGTESQARPKASQAQPKADEEESDEALREVMNIPSFLRRTED